MDDWSLPKPRLALLLEHFAAVEDVREPWRVAYPLREVLFLAVCATIANCDDYEDIVDWGEANLKFLRGFSDSPARAAPFPSTDPVHCERAIAHGLPAHISIAAAA